MAVHLEGLKLERFFDDGTYPNSQLPVLFYEAALPAAGASPEAFEAMFAENGWPPAWRLVDLHLPPLSLDCA